MVQTHKLFDFKTEKEENCITYISIYFEINLYNWDWRRSCYICFVWGSQASDLEESSTYFIIWKRLFTEQSLETTYASSYRGEVLTLSKV